jgi:hypothetical protein
MIDIISFIQQASNKQSIKTIINKKNKMSTTTEIKQDTSATETKVKEPRVPKEPRLPTKASFAKLRTFFTDTSARHYYRHTTKLSAYFNNRVSEFGKGDEKEGTATNVFWVVLTGQQTVPVPNSKVMVITKHGSPAIEAVDAADGKVAVAHVPAGSDETREMHFVDSSFGKELSAKSRRKTGWVIAHGPKEIFQLFETQRAAAVVEQKQSRLSNLKSAKVAKTEKAAKKAQELATKAAASASSSSSAAPATSS